MMKKLATFWLRISNGKIALAVTLLFILFTALVLPNQSQKAEAYSKDVGAADLMLWYTPEDVFDMAEAYGPEGRQAYIEARLSFDVLWPIVYTLFFSLTIAYLIKDSQKDVQGLQSLTLLPFGALMFDYIENGLAAYVMARYPVQAQIAVMFLPPASFTKWVLVGMSTLALLFLLIYWLWIKARKTLKRSS